MYGFRKHFIHQIIENLQFVLTSQLRAISLSLLFQQVFLVSIHSVLDLLPLSHLQLS